MVASKARQLILAVTGALALGAACTLVTSTANANAYGNYSSVLIGEMAAGMGGAFTGLTGDPAGCSYYNPATLSRMRGTSLSATANIYNKYDTSYGDRGSFSGASSRINRGSFRSIPASAGSVAAFGPFAIGLSIIVPSYDFFSGPIKTSSGQDTSLSLLDESLWVGGNMAINLSEASSVGFSLYYTSRFLQKQTFDTFKKGNGFAILNSEEKTLNNNSLVYILGFYHRLDSNWSMGMSYRFPSLEIHGRGTYFSSQIDTQTQTEPVQEIRNEIPSETRIPMKAAVGVAYTQSGRFTVSGDVSYYGRESYYDMDDSGARDFIEHKDTLNLALGAEFFLKHWLRLRTGVFTNFSSYKSIENQPTERRGDHIDMLGASANFAVFTSNKVSFTFGGYYTGGQGETVERVNQTVQKISKTKQIFSMLIGSAYFF